MLAVERFTRIDEDRAQRERIAELLHDEAGLRCAPGSAADWERNDSM